MADKKISELDAITGADTAADDYFVVVDTSGQVTKKISRAELNNAIEQDVLAQVSITDLGSDLNTNGNDINFGDNDKATFGSGDLEIYHDSLNSYIVDSGTGDLIVQGGNNVFIKDGSGNNMLRTTDGAQVRLYYGNATRLDTTATGVDVTGTVVADTLSLNSSTDFGIGTISSDTNWGMYFRSDNVGGSDPANADFNFASNANENRLRIGSGGDISFYDNTGVTQGLFWDADQQSLGLGTTSPTHELTVSAANDSGIRIDAEGNNVALMLTDETTSNGFRLNYNAPSDVLSFDTTNGTGAKVSERMRIDSSGNLLVGQSTQNSANAGVSIEQGGKSYFTRDGGHALDVNRLNSDGDIAVFRKDNSTVGSINVTSGNLSIDTNNKAGLLFAANVILPKNNGAISDGTVDLGRDDPYRFKDLYLSGGVYLGGTGSANHLDDYEEGTWTPAPSTNSGANSSFGSASGKYVKIGSLVFITAVINNINTTGTTAGSQLRIIGFPFTIDTQDAIGSMTWNHITTPYNQANPEAVSGEYILFRSSNPDADNTRQVIDHQHLVDGVSDIHFSITYHTNQ